MPRKPSKPDDDGAEQPKKPRRPKHWSQPDNTAANGEPQEAGQSGEPSQRPKHQQPGDAAPPAGDYEARIMRVAASPGASRPRLLALRAFHQWLAELHRNGGSLAAADPAEALDPPGDPTTSKPDPDTDRPNTPGEDSPNGREP